jgi:hypothetical protein
MKAQGRKSPPCRRGKGRASAFLLLALAACASSPPYEPLLAPDGFVCHDGHVLRTSLEPDEERVVLTTSKDALTLLRVPAEQGERYAARGGYEFWLDGDIALFTFPGGRQTVCRYRAPFTPRDPLWASVAGN